MDWGGGLGWRFQGVGIKNMNTLMTVKDWGSPMRIIINNLLVRYISQCQY